MEQFREKLLKPVLVKIDRRGLRGQIDCIAWSSGFPTAINLKGDIGQTKTQRIFTPVGSINGLTYLHESVLKKDVNGYPSLVSNGYFRRAISWLVAKPLPVELTRKCAATMQQVSKGCSWQQAADVLVSALGSCQETPGCDWHWLNVS